LAFELSAGGALPKRRAAPGRELNLKLAADQSAEQRGLSGLCDTAGVLMNETGPSDGSAVVAATVNIL